MKYSQQQMDYAMELSGNGHDGNKPFNACKRKTETKETYSKRKTEGNITMTVAYSSYAETEAFSEGYVWGYKKGCLSMCEMCLKMLDDTPPDKIRAILESEISRLCQEIEDKKW